MGAQFNVIRTGYPFAATPPDIDYAGLVDDTAGVFTDHIAAEQRRTWTAPSESLVVRSDGNFGSRHHTLARFEEGGFRRLLIYYHDCFPRAFPTLSKLSAATFARVWSDLYQPTHDEVQVQERVGPEGRVVWGVSPPTFDHSYNVASLVRDVADLFNKPVPCLLRYTSADSHVALLLSFPDFNVKVSATDHYDAGGIGVSVVTKEGLDLGDPLPDVKKRRREGGTTVIDGVAAKIKAAPRFYKDRTK